MSKRQPISTSTQLEQYRAELQRIDRTAQPQRAKWLVDAIFALLPTVYGYR